MRSTLFFSLAAFVSTILACDNPKVDACASAFTASSGSAAAFCATYTTASSTATTGLPAFATACAWKPKKLSSACSCLKVATTLQTSVRVASTSTTVVSSSIAKITTTTKETTSTKVTTCAKVSSSSTKAIPSTKITTSAKVTTSAKATLSTKVTTSAKATTSAKVSSSSKKATSSSAAKATTSGSASPKATSTVAVIATTAITVAAAPTSCTASEYAQITTVVKACTNIVLENISAPASSAILLTGLKVGSTVTFAGTTNFGYTEDSSFNPIEISGTDITITGATGHIIDGNGPAYWDGQGSNGGSDKPDHFIVLDNMINGVIANLKIRNWPTHCFAVTDCDGLKITGLTLDNSAGNAPNSASGKLAAAHNTDGFDFSSSNNVVLSNTVVNNQDDCVAITSGENITVTEMNCIGGHGLSIGSVGGKSNNVVSNIVFSDSTISDSQNGCRIKSNSNTTGSITGITYKNILLSGITDYGIDVQQDYSNGHSSGKPTNGVMISDITFANVTGTSTSSAMNYYILCGSGSCSDFSMTDVSITGGGGSSCNFPSTGCP